MKRFLIGLGVMGLVLAGCGDDDDTESSTPTTAETTDASGAQDSVSVTMSDYAYAVSGQLKAGGTLQLRNAGKEIHMVAVGKFKEGKTLDDLKAAFAQPPAEGEGEGEGEEESDPTAEIVDEVALPVGAFMFPGQSAGITVPEFGAGKYALICYLPVEGTEDPHFSKGMVSELTVEGAKAAEPTADATYSLEAGKAITGPATLTAGRHVLKLTAAAGSEDLEPALLKPDAGKTVADIDKAFDAFDESGLPVGAADLVPGDVIAGVFDLGPVKTMYLTVDLTPGTYVLIAQDSDAEDAPSEPVEKVSITVS